MNYLHEILIYRENWGLEEMKEDEDQTTSPTPSTSGILKQVGRVSVPHMSSGVVANETLIIGTSIKNGWL